ncbi:unnamed protein product [Penicillium viridicatum]
MAGVRLCPACGQSGHPLRECPFRDFYSPGQQKASPAGQQQTSPTGQEKVSPTPFQIPVTKTAPISYARNRLMAVKKRDKVLQPRSRDFKPKSSPLAQYSESSMPSGGQKSSQNVTKTSPKIGDNAAETTPAAESTPSKDTERKESV